jgi:GT2 family glycosyltransferase
VAESHSQTNIQSGLALCVCTYRRRHLLELLLQDALKQTLLPKSIIIVDGDPLSGQVQALLRALDFPASVSVHFIPSNYSNLSYQRYLGWLAASLQQAYFLLYLDDDLRIGDRAAIKKLMRHLLSEPQVAGCTTAIRMGSMDKKFSSYSALREQSTAEIRFVPFATPLRSSRKILPGGITPVGHRIPPSPTGDMSVVEWLHGGVMLFRMQSLPRSSFSADLFAMDHIRCGKGEDTFLSRQAMRSGKLIYANDVVIDHPNSDLPAAYPISAYKLAYATAYSRRFLNDHYRIDRRPYFVDRLDLLKSYAGTNLINVLNALLNPRPYRFAYAFGYLWGSLRGLVQSPTVNNLTPHIDWWRKAEEAVSQMVTVQ